MIHKVSWFDGPFLVTMTKRKTTHRCWCQTSPMWVLGPEGDEKVDGESEENSQSVKTNERIKLFDIPVYEDLSSFHHHTLHFTSNPSLKHTSIVTQTHTLRWITSSGQLKKKLWCEKALNWQKVTIYFQKNTFRCIFTLTYCLLSSMQDSRESISALKISEIFGDQDKIQ